MESLTYGKINHLPQISHHWIPKDILSEENIKFNLELVVNMKHPWNNEENWSEFDLLWFILLQDISWMYITMYLKPGIENRTTKATRKQYIIMFFNFWQ